MKQELLSPIAPDRAQPQRPEPEDRDEVLCTADLAECTCPDFCERDHEND